jgi:hypothetical protein
MHTIPVALLFTVLMIPAWGFAQTSPTSDDRDRTLSTTAIQLPGSIRARVAREPFRLAPIPAAVRQQPARAQSWRGRHPVLFGALVGLGVGFAVQAVVIPGASGGEPHSAYLPMFGGIGAGVGSLVGLIVSRR